MQIDSPLETLQLDLLVGREMTTNAPRRNDAPPTTSLRNRAERDALQEGPPSPPCTVEGSPVCLEKSGPTAPQRLAEEGQASDGGRKRSSRRTRHCPQERSRKEGRDLAACGWHREDPSTCEPLLCRRAAGASPADARAPPVGDAGVAAGPDTRARLNTGGRPPRKTLRKLRWSTSRCLRVSRSLGLSWFGRNAPSAGTPTL